MRKPDARVFVRALRRALAQAWRPTVLELLPLVPLVIALSLVVRLVAHVRRRRPGTRDAQP